MRGINALAVWIGAVLFITISLILLFYTAALLLPIILAVFAFSIIASWVRMVYRKSQGEAENVKVYYKKTESGAPSSSKKPSPKIIDAEYEIIDDDK